VIPTAQSSMRTLSGSCSASPPSAPAPPLGLHSQPTTICAVATPSPASPIESRNSSPAIEVRWSCGPKSTAATA